MHSYVLETERLILRPLTVDDAEAVFVWVSDPEVNRYMPYPIYTEVEAARQWIETASQKENYYLFGFERREDGLLIGSGDISPRDGLDQPWAFGYNLRRDCWRQGYATEATRAMIDFARREFGVRDFQAEHAAANVASGKVIEKCGLIFDHDGEYGKYDGSEVFPAKFYKLHLEDEP